MTIIHQQKVLAESRELYLKVRDRVESIGATTVLVEDKDRFYAYSVGLAGYDLPDLIVFGETSEVSQIINKLVESVLRRDVQTLWQMQAIYNNEETKLLSCFPDIANDLMWQCHKYYLEHDVTPVSFKQIYLLSVVAEVQENSYISQ